MPNVHSLFSNRDSDDDDSHGDENNRYVGGVSARGGGSGLAVTPNVDEADGIFSAIRSNAEQVAPGSSSQPPRRTITLYKSSFVVDNGPERRLDDPSNAEFLRDLAKGVVPRELMESEGDTNVEVGLIDKRSMEYGQDSSTSASSTSASASQYGRRTEERSSVAFTGEGQSLGTAASQTSSGGIITPATTATQPSVDESKPTTVIQVRLLNGKRLRIKIEKCAKVSLLIEHIHASGEAGTEDYLLSSGFPPQVLNDFEKTIEECGLVGAQVIQKKA